ncbi:MAG: hypothetical protein L0387_01405 [Acidobacteria bacterium]|nr:hypothetical protein [Acidobacteriota bacterium]MCI0724281.1 hypothetical protein [Acidobacteriota bacterium]
MNAPAPILVRKREVVVGKRRETGSMECAFAGGGSLRISSFLGAHVNPGDEIQFSLPDGDSPLTPELLIRRTARDCLYQTSIGYVARPKTNRLQHAFASAAISDGRLGFTCLHLPCSAIKSYFYSGNRGRDPANQSSLYDLLRARPNASPKELRLAWKLRELELLSIAAPSAHRAALARAFNILSVPELRACYDASLEDPKAPALFPFAGFGLILVSGTPIDDRFLVRQILSFIPERQGRHFKLSLRKLDYSGDKAVYRDSRVKLEVTLDPLLLPLGFEPSWNRWKHLLETSLDVHAEFVKTGKYIRKGNQWKLVTWETALASRIEINLPDNLEGAVNTAKRTYRRFGQYSSWIEEMRQRIERDPMEKRTLERLGAAEGIPGDFDVALINWKPDYDRYYYEQLLKGSRRLFLFRNEYLFETATSIVVETPQAGHATYLFSVTDDLEAFLCVYIQTTKEAIRHNQDNCAERLGYLGRVVHGRNRKVWLAEISKFLGEPVDCSLAPDDE